jgi:hypothetical protein
LLCFRNAGEKHAIDEWTVPTRERAEILAATLALAVAEKAGK